MSFKKLNHREKQQLFEFIAALAILAGKEMSKEGYAEYNETVLYYLDQMDLIGDFMAASKKAGIGKHPYLANSGRC